MKPIVLVLMVAATLLTGKSMAQLRALPITVPNKIYELERYSVLAPQGRDWFELKLDRHNVFFGKRIKSRTHAFIATAMSVQITEKFEKPEEFRDYLSKAPLEPSDKRSTLIENRAELDESIGRFCVRIHTRAVDRGAVYAKGRPMLLETFGVSCLHPADPGLAISISFSERGHPAETSAELRAQGENFVRSLKFTGVNP